MNNSEIILHKRNIHQKGENMTVPGISEEYFWLHCNALIAGCFKIAITPSLPGAHTVPAELIYINMLFAMLSRADTIFTFDLTHQNSLNAI